MIHVNIIRSYRTSYYNDILIESIRQLNPLIIMEHLFIHNIDEELCLDSIYFH